MTIALPFVRLTSPSHEAEPEALLGFSLSSAPRSSKHTSSNEQERLREALQSQVNLVKRFWNSNITAWDLRFVRTNQSSDVAVGLLCRLHRPSQLQPMQFHDYCLETVKNIQQLFTEFGYQLSPLTDEPSLNRYLSPFSFRAVAEIRRREGLLILEDTYTEYEIYVTYPWEWTAQNREHFLEALRQQRADCLISICLEPTQLIPQEQALLNHATSWQLRGMLLDSGPQGEIACGIYEDFARSLHRPYLLRIGLAASTPQILQRAAQKFLDELNTARPHGMGAILQFPRNEQEQYQASYSLLHLAWASWGNIRGMDMPDTARLRYLIDDKGASMAFRLPVASAAMTSTSRTIKVLLVFANPRGTDPLRLGTESRVIGEAIRLSRYRDNIALTERHAATIHDLRRALLDEEFQIIHIAGHGTDRGLVLEDESGRAHVIHQEFLADLFKAYSPPIQCVVLNACYTISQGQLISLGIPFTIAVEGALGDKAAREFARGFYDAIGAGREIDFAYEEGYRTARLVTPNSPIISKLFQRT